jgi:hypothetical protein
VQIPTPLNPDTLYLVLSSQCPVPKLNPQLSTLDPRPSTQSSQQQAPAKLALINWALDWRKKKSQPNQTKPNQTLYKLSMLALSPVFSILNPLLSAGEDLGWVTAVRQGGHKVHHFADKIGLALHLQVY